MLLKSISTLILFFALALAGFSQEVLFFPKVSHDFGLVLEGDIASTEFEFENTTDDTIRLSNVKPSCGCTSPFWTKDPVAPGESGNIKINYNSKGRPGEFIKNVAITIDGYTEKQQVRIKGVVEKPLSTEISEEEKNSSPTLSLSKAAHSFGKVERNKPIAVKIKVSNQGQTALKISGVKAGCHCVAHNLDVSEIPAGSSGTLELTYTPRYLGEAIENLVILSNDVNNPRQAFTLQGEVVKSLVTNSIMQQQTFGF